MTNLLPIESDRLALVSMSPDFLKASLQDDRAAASHILGASISPEWFDEQDLIRLRLADLDSDPLYQQWSLRAIVLRARQHMIGHIGFHSRPHPPYLAEIAPSGIEFGYTIYPDFRRNGYAVEASSALIHWAQQQHRIACFVLSIGADNAASLRIASRLGFVQVGTQHDPTNGKELIFVLNMPTQLT